MEYTIRSLIRKYKFQPVAQDLAALEQAVLRKGKEAATKSFLGCVPCKAAAAAYMEVLGQLEAPSQISRTEMIKPLSPKRF